nr:serine carboxypeptidase-like 45 [Ipomoea batatas]
MAFLWLLIFLASYYYSFLCTNAELISSLPGQPQNVTFKQYSDYIVTDDHHGRALFYYFVEAQSKDALSLPLTLWLNGGPGCSSIGLGLFMENGPFRPGKDGNLIKNEFSWNLVSNMLYVDSPVGVGFSYSNTSSDYDNWNDTMTADENLKFLLKWFEKFPEYRNLDLYLAGDSYAGHFVPQLAALLLEYSRNVKPIKLKGIALGNPLLDIVISVDSADYLWYHGAISAELRTMKKKLCNDTRFFLEISQNKASEDCKKMMAKMDEELGVDFDTGDMLLPRCVSGQHHVGSETTGIGDPCLADRIIAYINKPEVQKALHANTTALPYLWDLCSGPIKYQMDNLAINIIPTLSAFLKKEHIPILLYSGDQDVKVPVTQTRKIANLLARHVKLTTLQENGPWYNGYQVGGWSEAFGKLREGKNVTYLTFATVKGGAHMVPFTSPSQSLILFRSFINGSPPPTTRLN